MDKIRASGYSRLGFGSQQSSAHNTEIELTTPGIEQTSTSYEPYSNTAFRSTPEVKQVEQLGHRTNTHWDPFFLRAWVLISFALFFAAVVAALQVLYSVSQNNDGIATSRDDEHYLWTYGPTAVFVIVTVLWRQVDYASKSIQPWANMASGPQPVGDSLLLDYVTPLQFLSLWRSLKRGHFNVSASIAVFILIKVITVLSTGIFSLQTVQRFGVPTSIALNNTFTSTNFQNATNVDSRAAYVAYGGAFYNISLPVGTSNQFAVQAFAPSTGVVNGSLTYSAPVDVFFASLSSCETGKINYTVAFNPDDSTSVAAYYNTTVTLPGCEIFNATLDAPDWRYATNDTAHRFGYRASFQNVTCSNLSPSDPTRFRFMLSAAYSEGSGFNDNTLLNSSNVVCIPSYSFQTANVTLDVLGNVQSVNLTGTPRQLNGASAANIGQGVLASVLQAYSISDSSAENLVLDPFTTLMQQETAGFTAKDLLDPAYLNKTGNKVYSAIAAQLANIYLLTDNNENAQPLVEGTISKTESRLFARQIPIRIMQGAGGLMILLVAVILFVRPRGVVPRDIDSIAAVAAILARSPELEARLRGTGHKSLEELREILAPHKYMTTTGHDNGARSFAVHMLSRSGTELNKLSDDNSSAFHNIKWVQPFILRRFGMALTILASIAAIVTLEILLSQSRKHDGLSTVDDSSATRYSWLYAPVLVFLLLATLFNIMDFEVEFTESFHALARADCDARSSMLWYPLRHVSVHATYSGLRHGRFALTAASISALLAPFLTIVVSGLFTSKASIQTTPVPINALNWFNTTTLHDTSTNVPLLVIEGNMSYPQWTYNELAIPQMNLVGNTTDQLIIGGGSLSVDTPAIRAGANCSVVPKDRIVDNSISDGYQAGTNVLNTNISMPDGCGNSGFIDQPYNSLSMGFSIPANTSGYYGYTSTIGFLDGCPTIVLYYGHVTDNKLDDFTAVLCKQNLDRVQANVTFNLPGYSISTDPVVYPGSAVNFSSFRATFPTLQVLDVGATDDQLDETFNAMVYGKDGIPTHELLDSDTLISSYTHLYRQYTAQVVGISLRAEFSTLSNNATESIDNPLFATYINPNHYRLKQSPLSTHVLVGVVGALLLCALVVFITIDMRNVLPKPLGSIAAVASLLAGSRIVDPSYGMIPPGSEYWSDEQWEKSGVWQAEKFRMGWWDKSPETVDTSGSNWKGIGQSWSRGSSRGGDEVSEIGGREIYELPGSFRIDARPKIG